MLGSDKDPAVEEAAKELCGSYVHIVELRQSKSPGIKLVRPDGYLAYSAGKEDGIAGLAVMRSLLERQTS